MDIFDTHTEGLGQSMLPFVMRDLVDMVMKKKSLPFEDALYYIYTSSLYKSLLDERTKLWYSGTLLLYEMLEKEKAKRKKMQNNDTRILLFKLFCLENYRKVQHLSGEETLLRFSNYQVFEFLTDNFEMLHTQDVDYIIDTITTYINKKK